MTNEIVVVWTKHSFVTFILDKQTNKNRETMKTKKKFFYSKMPQKFQPKIRTDKRLRLEIDELLADVNDFMWLWHGWPIWIYRKLKYAPNTISANDRQQIKRLLTDQIPDPEQLSFVRRMIETQLPESDERKNRIEKLDRAISNTEHGRSFLIELLQKIDDLLGPQKPQSLELAHFNDLELQSQSMDNGSSSNKYVATSWKSLTEIFTKKPRSFRSRQFIELLMMKNIAKVQDVSAAATAAYAAETTTTTTIKKSNYVEKKN